MLLFVAQARVCFTLKKGAMPIPELTSGCIIWDLVVLYILTPDEDRDGDKCRDDLRKNCQR